MKIIVTVFISIFLSLHLSAQENVISGKVIDQQTGEPLAGATIKHISSGRQVMTDFDGQFSLPVPVSGFTEISVSFVSYGEVKLNRVHVSNIAPDGLNIKMRRVGAQHYDNKLATTRLPLTPTS